jgi:hypothetical protein
LIFIRIINNYNLGWTQGNFTIATSQFDRNLCQLVEIVAGHAFALVDAREANLN